MALSEKVGSCSRVHLYQSFTLSTLSRIYDLRSNALYPTNNNNASGLGDISEKKEFGIHLACCGGNCGVVRFKDKLKYRLDTCVYILAKLQKVPKSSTRMLTQLVHVSWNHYTQRTTAVSLIVFDQFSSHF